MKHRPTVSTSLAILLALTLSGAAQAHRPWLLPSASEVDGKEPWVTVDAAVSENLFDVDGNALKLDGLTISGPDGQPVSGANVLQGKQRNSVELKLTQPGTYKFSLVTASAMASYTLNGETKRWRGHPDDLAQAIPAQAEALQVSRTHQRLDTYVSANQSSPSAVKPAGSGLELLPLSPPTGLLAGEASRFRVLLDGKPLANQQVAVVPGGVRHRGVLKDFAVTSNSQGEFSVTWPFAQHYWLQASYPPRAPAPAAGQPRPAPPAQRFVSVLTVEVTQP